MTLTQFDIRSGVLYTRPMINESSTTNCSFDLAQALTVEATADADEANRLLQDGWVLIHVGIDGNGFPLFMLADPSEEWAPSTSKNTDDNVQRRAEIYAAALSNIALWDEMPNQTLGYEGPQRVAHQALDRAKEFST